MNTDNQTRTGGESANSDNESRLSSELISALDFLAARNLHGLLEAIHDLLIFKTNISRIKQTIRESTLCDDDTKSTQILIDQLNDTIATMNDILAKIRIEFPSACSDVEFYKGNGK